MKFKLFITIGTIFSAIVDSYIGHGRTPWHFDIIDILVVAFIPYLYVWAIKAGREFVD